MSDAAERSPGRTLWEALGDIPDRRGAKGRRYPLRSVLTLSLAAMLAGGNDLCSIFRWGRRLPPEALYLLGLKRAPCHAMYHYFYVPLLLCTTTSMYHYFYVPLLLCTTTSMYHYFYVPLLLRTTTSTYHYFYVPLLLRTTTSTYHYVYVPLRLRTTTSTYHYVYVPLRLRTTTSTYHYVYVP